MAALDFCPDVTPKSSFGLLGKCRFAKNEVVFEEVVPVWQAGGELISIGMPARGFEKFTDGEIEVGKFRQTMRVPSSVARLV